MSSTIIRVKLTPKAAKNAVQGWEEDHLGEKLLKCTVTAVPEKGKANKALIALLSAYTGLPKGAFSIKNGETARLKTVEIQGVTDTSTFASPQP